MIRLNHEVQFAAELNMRFAICNETFQDWPFDKAFEYARKCGYTGIEFAPFTMGSDAGDISPQKRSEVRAQCEDAGLEVIGLHWLLAKTEGFYLTSSDTDVQKKTTDYFIQLAELCRDLGGKIMVLGSPQQRNLLPGIDHPKAMEIAAGVIKGAVGAFQDCGITVALEPLGPAEGDFLLTAESGIELAKMIDSPNVRLHLDVKAMSSEETDVCDIIRNSADHIAHFHANDPNKRGPGMGDVDFVPILKTLQDVGYDGWVSVEVFDYSPGIETLATESINYLQECLAKIGKT